MKKSSKKEHNFNFIKLVPFIIAVIAIFITIGFSTPSDSLAMGGKARVLVDAVVRVTNVLSEGTTNSGQITFLDFGEDWITTDINLPNANSTVTLNVYVTNLGNTEMGLTEITGLPSNIKATLTGYNLGASLCDSNDSTQCVLGSVTNFQITLEYDTNGYNANTTSYSLNLGCIFEEIVYTARIGQNKYLTIQDAIDAAPSDGTETTVVLLRNVYQRIQVWRGKNIVLDMPNLVLHNLLESQNASGDPVVEIFGNKANENDNSGVVGSAILKMTNGTIISEVNQGAINVERGGTFIMTGGSILTSGNRQAIYIKSGGTAEISGTSYLRSTAEIAPNASPPNYRATVHNFAGTLTITGGTIEAVGNNGIALTSESTTTIGTKDGSVSTTVPTFIANDTGIRINAGTTFNFYDGIAKGKVKAFLNENEVDDVETGYDIVHSGEAINGNEYDTAYLGHGVTLTYNLDGGTQTEVSRVVAVGAAVGPLPTPTKTDYVFVGWYDSNGNQVGPTTTISTNTTFIAHWVLSDPSVARIGTAKYNTLADAIAAVPANTETTITILKDIDLSAIISLPSNYNLIIDLNDHTINTTAGTIFETQNGTILKIDDNGANGTGALTGGKVTNNKQITVIKNVVGGTVYIRGGTISSAVSQVIDNNGIMNISGGEIKNTVVAQGVINNNGGATLTMTGGTISGENRQAIYNKGTVSISGNAILTSSSSDRATLQNDDNSASMTISGGTISSTNTGIALGTINNNKGTLVVTGGTITSNSTNANASGIQNSGSCTIGVLGGGIDTTTPLIRAYARAIYNNKNKTLKIYDGMFQSHNSPVISGNYTTIEPNSQPNTSGSIVFDGITYYTWYLESTN